jgi:hypothetical protein
MRLCHRGVRLQRKKRTTVATLLGPELGPIVREWLKRIQLVPELARLSLRDEARAGHLPKLFHDLICQLTFPDAQPPSPSASAHGRKRQQQGHGLAMLVEESKLVR